MAASKRILFLNNSIGYVVSDNGKLLVTTNGGRDFVTAHQSDWIRITDMASVDPNQVYLSGIKSQPSPPDDCSYPDLPNSSYGYEAANVVALLPLPSDPANVLSYVIDGNRIDFVTTGGEDFIINIQLAVRPSNACGLNMTISGAEVEHVPGSNTVYDASFTISDGIVTAHDGPDGFTDVGYDGEFDIATSVDVSWPANRRTVHLSGTSEVDVTISFCWVVVNTDISSPVGPYYIDYVLGDDNTGDGSSSAPYRTLAKALSVVVDGDTILVRGDGSEDTIYYERNLTTGLSDITISADVGATPIFSTSDKYTSWAKTAGRTNVYETSYLLSNIVGCWNGADLLTEVGDLGLCDSTANSYYLHNGDSKLYVNIGGGAPSQINTTRNTNPLITFSGDNLTISGDITVQWASQGLQFTGTGNELSGWMLRYIKGAGANSAVILITGQTNITNLSINYQTMFGILVAGSSSGCVIDTCTITTTIEGEACVCFKGGTGHEVLDCILTGGREAGVQAEMATVYVEGTVAVNFGRVGFYVGNGATMTASRCLAFLTYDTNVVECYGFLVDEDTAPANLTCDHCVTANLERNTHPPVYPSCAYCHNSSGTMTITNSIAYSSYSGIGMTGAFPSGLVVESYNCVYNNSVSNYVGIVADLSDVIADPIFVDNATNDYHLQVTSPCIDAGTPAGSDIGAYEYS